MIYLVTKQRDLFGLEGIEYITLEESLSLLSEWDIIQFDSETSGRDPHICDFLSIQLGNRQGTIQVVIDAITIDVSSYKHILESKYLVGHNLKFDLQFCYKHNIIPRKVYDTMIVEQFLYLGYPNGIKKYSLKDVAFDRLGIYLDKTIRGEIIWRGLDLETIRYGARDVEHLCKIMDLQIKECKEKNCLIGAKLECDVVPAMAYLEWSGIHLDVNKWKEKMQKDEESLREATAQLNAFIIKLSEEDKRFSPYVFIDRQGDLFTGFDLTPKCTINWSSSQQAVKIAKLLGFDTTVQDKKTGEDKDSVLEKHLRNQKGINDEFLSLYFKYQEYAKVVSSFGQGHLDAVNPKTNRLHTVFRQLGAASGRMSCGSQNPNTDLAKLKNISPKRCTYLNLQQLPSDKITRACFTAPSRYNFVSADFSAEESRLGADIYQDKEFLKEFTEGSKDTHNMFAWVVYNKECKELGCKDASDVKKKAPQLRKAVKGFEFGWLFGAAAPTLANTAGCTVEEAQRVINILEDGFSGVSSFAKKGSAFVRKHGYIIINPQTGHRLNWWDHKEWVARQHSFTQEFWDEYRTKHKGTSDNVAIMVRQHFQAAGKYDRMARNVVTQGTGAIILKEAMTRLFNWIVDNGYFGIIHICVVVHDEINCDYPREIKDFPEVLTTIMEQSAAKYCKSLPIPAEAEVGDHWIH